VSRQLADFEQDIAGLAERTRVKFFDFTANHEGDDLIDGDIRERAFAHAPAIA
jgi:hypothetical protein